MNDPVVATALVALGALLGLLSTILTSANQQRKAVTLKLLDEYFSVRRAIVDAISDLTNIELQQELDAAVRHAHRDKVAKLFYMHYDYLPREVLDSMLLLQVCLDKPELGLLGLSGESLLPLDKEGSIRLIEECSLTKNASMMAALALNSGNPTIRRNQAIKLHARYVLYAMNMFCSPEDLLGMARRFKKTRKPRQP